MLFALLAAALIAAPPASAAATPLRIGDTLELASVPLKQQRTVNIVLPAGYEQNPARRYPVLYVIDGGVEQDLLHVSGVAWLGALWGRSAEVIVVGVETEDRRRELVGPTRDPDLLKRYPTAGSSASFRRFLTDEVKPAIARRYRTNGRDILLGESLAGLFAVETYLVEPEAFGAYGAIDPSLWWDKEALSKVAASRLGARKKGRPLLMAAAKEQLEEPAAWNRIVGALRTAGLDRCLLPRPDLTHATIYQQLTPAALQHLAPPAAAPDPAYGFTVACQR